MAKTPSPKVKAVQAFEKDYTALRNYLVGKGFWLALKAMALAEKYHVGTRKDGYTPEFHHQVSIAWTIINLRGIEPIEEHCIVLAFLHDVMEDYDLSLEEIAKDFGDEIADDVYALSKKHRGEVKTTEAYHAELAEKPQRIIAKGADNSHNVQSMHGAFKPEKITSYLADTKANKLPLLKLGRKRFPQYHFAFTGLSFMLKRQVELYTAHQSALAVESRRHASSVREAIASRDAANGASTAALLERTQAANKAIQADLESAREQIQFARNAAAQGIEFEKSKYQHFAAAVLKVLREELKGPALKKVWVFIASESEVPGKSFDLPSDLKLPSQLDGLDDSIADFGSSTSGGGRQGPYRPYR